MPISDRFGRGSWIAHSCTGEGAHASACVRLFDQRGGSPLQVVISDLYPRVTASTARQDVCSVRGGKQLEEKDQSVVKRTRFGQAYW